ncbi:MAG: HD domain-containing protein [Candidatus Paceibacterota bacterium]
MDIPQEVKTILETLGSKGFKAYAVGGCVRDLLLGVEPKDWDITTDANPVQIQEIFPKNFYANNFGTVTVLANSKNPLLQNIEITPFRTESMYEDRRHPGKVEWAQTIEEDLSRRDFTINAMALDLAKNIIDPFEGQKDLEAKLVRAVREPSERFEEDALRLMRAVRFTTVLGFRLEEKTFEAICQKAKNLKDVSAERVRDELVKIVACPRAHKGIELMRETGLLQIVLPELLEGYKVGQNKHHKFDVYEHSLKSLEYADKKDFPALVKLASLLHDIGKPKTKRGQGINSTFYGHEVVGGRMAAKIMERLRFSKKDSEKVVSLVRYHLFYYNAGEVTESSVRRLIRNVGTQNVEDLLLVRQADRIGSGCPKAEPYKLRHLRYIIDKVSQDPISPKMLKLNGNDLMQLLGVAPGPKIGQILDVLLERVIDDPSLNGKDKLAEMAKQLAQLPEKELLSMRAQASKGIDSANEQADKSIKKRHRV